MVRQRGNRASPTDRHGPTMSGGHLAGQLAVVATLFFITLAGNTAAARPAIQRGARALPLFEPPSHVLTVRSHTFGRHAAAKRTVERVFQAYSNRGVNMAMSSSRRRWTGKEWVCQLTGSRSVLQEVRNRLAADNKLKFRSLKLGQTLAWQRWATVQHQVMMTQQYAPRWYPGGM